MKSIIKLSFLLVALSFKVVGCSANIVSSDGDSEDEMASDDAPANLPEQPSAPLGDCSVGETRCVDGFEQECGANGLWLNTGRRGDCEVDQCAEARLRRSYIGCDYWAVDLDNAVEVRAAALDPVGLPRPGGDCESVEPGTVSRNLEVCANSEGIIGLCLPTNPQCPDGFICMSRDLCVHENRCPQSVSGDEELALVTDVPVCSQGQYRLGLCNGDGSCPMGFTCGPAPTCVTDAQRSPFAIVVSNPSDETLVQITVTAPNGWIAMEELAPGAVKQIFPESLGWDDYSIDGTGLSQSAYRINSTGPIVAYQFNPLDNVGVFSNDGSLLLPEHAYDTIYYVLGYQTLERRPANHDYHGYVTILASADGQTDVTITPTVDIRAGQNQGALTAGMPHTFTLQQGDVLNLEASTGGDLTGSRVESTNGQSFAVFVGHEAMLLSPPGRASQTPRPCCADHIEEQLFPASTWGRSFAVARTFERPDAALGGAPVPDLLRILAQKDGTQLVIDPLPVSGRCPELAASEYCDVFIQQDTVITADEPILVGHFLASTDTDSQNGDPGLAFEPPSEQFREDYTILVPEQYAANYTSIVARSGIPVALDGQDVTSRLQPFQQMEGNADRFSAGRFPLMPGQHRIECPGGCGILVYGYSTAVSYLFAGGLDLEQITVP